ncbi:MAG TPA: SPOR domain-containing protein [Sphingomonadaceae bacterium]
MDPAFPAARPALWPRAARYVALLAISFGAPALAQQRDVLVPVGTSHEVVQPLPPKGTSDLDDALKRLAADPRDSAALIQAGDASLKLNDVDAAIGFYTRAEALGASGGEAKAGLAAAQVYKKMPVEALRLFDEAERAGVSRTVHASDHGLAYDLVGDNAHAQEYYRLALQQYADDETTRRLALSEAIGGDQAASERTLLPLLQHRDLASYRTRAFALAALGKADEAVSIADTMMPAALAGRIAPYLRYMPRLTRAQQAAAANFGHFPEANAIGRDDARIAAYAARSKVATAGPTTGDQRLVPTGAPLGSATRPAPARGSSTRPTPPANTAVTQTPSRSTASATTPPPRPAGSAVANLSTAPATQPTLAPAPRPVASAGPNMATQLPRPSVAVGASQPAPAALPPKAGFDLNAVPANKTGPIEVAQVEHSAPVPASAPPSSPPAVSRAAAAPPPAQSLEEAFAEFETVKTPARRAAGAVDVTAIKPAREAPPPKPEPPKAKPAKPKNPSRVWVQVATGGNRKALGKDWERITKKAPKEFRKRDGYLVDWGRTNRLVTGPFADEDKAQDFITELKKAGLSTFMFTSDDGEEVVPLPDR